LELRQVFVFPPVVLLVHLLCITFASVEHTAEFVFLVEWIHQLTVHDATTEVPGTTELVHEVRLVLIEEVDCLGEQRDELGLGLPEGEMPAAVEVADSIQLGVPERFAVVLLVSGDDVAVDAPVVTLGLSARVVHAGADW